MNLTERIRTLIRASDGALPVAIETALLDIASEVDTHIAECPNVAPPTPRPLQMTDRLLPMRLGGWSSGQ